MDCIAVVYGVQHGDEKDGENFIVTAFLYEEGLLHAGVKVSFKYNTESRKGIILLN